MTRAACSPCALLLLVVLTGCGTSGVRQKDGFWPAGATWRQAARNALRSPGTWAPAAGAAVAGVSGWDQDIAEWAVRETPVFGSPERAAEASGDLRTATHLGMLVTALAVPSEERRFKATLERLLWQHAAAIATTSLTRGLKEATARERPDGSDDQSFPSGHASRAFAYNAMGWRNLRATGLRRPARLGLGAGLTTLAAGTAWARVEAGVHYPSDVLAGAALGNFVALLVHDAFLGRRDDVQVAVALARGRPALTVQVRF